MSESDVPSAPTTDQVPEQAQPPRLTPEQRKKRRILAIIGSIAAFILGIAGSLVLLLYIAPPSPSDAEMIVRVLDMGELAPLPENAANVETGGDNSLFKMTLLLRFDATDGQIQQFIDASPGLVGVPVEILNPRHMFQPFPADGRGDPTHRHYLPDPRHTWWDPLVQTRGRYFETEKNSDGVTTQVIVDDDGGTVFIKVQRGAA